MIKTNLYKFLKWTEKWTKTDMIYLAKGGFWLTLGNFISSISGLLLAIAFANLVPKETYGTYKYILSIVSILSIPTLSGINSSLNRSIAQGNEGSFFIAIKTRIKWGLLGGLLSFFLSIYYFINKNHELGLAFMVSGIFIPFFDPVLLYQSILIGKKKFKILSIHKTIINTTTAISMFTLLLLYKNILFILIAYFSLTTLLRTFFLFLTLKKIKLNNQIDNDTTRFGKNLSLMNAINKIAQHVDKILIFHYLGTINLAIYFFSIAIPEQIRASAKNIATLAIPKMSKNNGINRDSIIIKIQKALIITIPIIIFYILLSPAIFNNLFPLYTSSIIYSQIFIFTIISIPFTTIGLSYLTANKQQNKLYQINIYGSIIKIVVIFIGTYNFGLIGAIYSRVIYQIILSWLIYIKI